jgi:hypothetical protein
VRASTFHSAALARCGLCGRPGRILPTKAPFLRQIGNCRPPYKFRLAGDLATEIEGEEPATDPQTYLAALGEPPLPADLAHRVFREYEKRKADAGSLDFEDLLEHTIRALEADAHALELVRERWRAFTVDEYQDVNLLQQTLLERWLGPRDDLCVVGDDYQSISGSRCERAVAPSAPRRYRGASRLEQNYRSTPQVLLANRLVPKLVARPRRCTRLSGVGPSPSCCRTPTSPAVSRNSFPQASRSRIRPSSCTQRAADALKGLPRGRHSVSRASLLPRRSSKASEGIPTTRLRRRIGAAGSARNGLARTAAGEAR